MQRLDELGRVVALVGAERDLGIRYSRWLGARP